MIRLERTENIRKYVTSTLKIKKKHRYKGVDGAISSILHTVQRKYSIAKPSSHRHGEFFKQQDFSANPLLLTSIVGVS